MFNLWAHVRNAACVVLLVASWTNTPALIVLGIILLMSSLVGGLDLSERRLALLEKIVLSDKKENTNEETDAH